MNICQPIASKIQMCQWYQTRKTGDSDKCNIISFQIQCDQIFHVAKEPIRDRRKLIGRKVKACYFLYSNKTIWFKNTYRAQNLFLDLVLKGYLSNWCKLDGAPSQSQSDFQVSVWNSIQVMRRLKKKTFRRYFSQSQGRNERVPFEFIWSHVEDFKICHFAQCKWFQSWNFILTYNGY